MIDATKFLVSGISLAAIIFGLVEFSKSLGLKGKALTVVSLLLGTAFGVAFKIAESGLPTGFAGWFAVIIFGLFLGLVASGFYDFADKRFPPISP